MEVTGLRILVADDHARMRDCIVRLLGADFNVVGAVSDGDELVTAALALEPDVIVSDICMPRLSGIEAKKCLQTLGADIPFVFVTASSYFTEDLMRGLGACIRKEDLASNLNAEVQSAAVERGICRQGDPPICGTIGESRESV
jgi:CheY-like chemotaxis protein